MTVVINNIAAEEHCFRTADPFTNIEISFERNDKTIIDGI